MCMSTARLLFCFVLCVSAGMLDFFSFARLILLIFSCIFFCSRVFCLLVLFHLSVCVLLMSVLASLYVFVFLIMCIDLASEDLPRS